MHGPEGKGRIRGFDGLRALAVVMVFSQHETVFGSKLGLGGYGVWLFFVLSGFLIVRILVDERRRIEAGTRTWRAAFGRFYWRRVLRIAPPYYMALACFTVLGALGWASDFPLRYAWWYWAHLSNFFFIVAGHFVGHFGHFWSLAVEEQFYLVAAPVLLLAVPSAMARRACAIAAVGAVVFDVIMRTSGASDVAVYVNPLTNFGALAFGGWIGLGLGPRVRTDGRASWPVLACAAFGVAWYVGYHALGAVPSDVANLIAALPLWTTTLVGGILLRTLYLNQNSLAAAVLEWGPIAGFGRISYGFYLYHNLLPRLLIGWLADLAGLSWHVPLVVEECFTFALALALSILSWRLVEKPLQALKDRPPRLAWLRLRPALAADLPASAE